VATFGAWQFMCDRQATVDAYAREAVGNSAQCTCIGCRNFVAARFDVFPKAFSTLLDSLGIDPTKDGEVYHNGRLSPGKHHYGGWFHFIGTLDVIGDFQPIEFGESFSVYFCSKSAPCLPALKDLPLVQVEFTASAVPWCLTDPEPD
jgi:hypothetical protein